jgi:hypothetical protein
MRACPACTTLPFGNVPRSVPNPPEISVSIVTPTNKPVTISDHYPTDCPTVTTMLPCPTVCPTPICPSTLQTKTGITSTPTPTSVNSISPSKSGNACPTSTIWRVTPCPLVICAEESEIVCPYQAEPGADLYPSIEDVGTQTVTKVVTYTAPKTCTGKVPTITLPKPCPTLCVSRCTVLATETVI